VFVSRNFNCGCDSDGQYESPYTISLRSDELLLILAIFGMQNGGHSPSNIFFKFEILSAVRVQRVKIRHPAKFRGDQSSRCLDMTIQRFSIWWPAAILDFLKLEILSALRVQKVNMRQFAQLRADWSKRCRDMAILRFFYHLDFKKLEFSTAAEVNMRHCSKFPVDRSNRCGNTAVFLFSR